MSVDPADIFPGRAPKTEAGPRITRDVPKLGKVRTPFLDMVLSWAAAGGEHAETRAKAIAAVIALARDRQDVEPRVDHFINEYDGP